MKLITSLEGILVSCQSLEVDCKLIQSPFPCYFSSVLTAQAPSTAVLLTFSWRTKHSRKSENAKHVQQYLGICCALISRVMSCLQDPDIVLVVCRFNLFVFSGSAQLRLASFSENCSSHLQFGSWAKYCLKDNHDKRKQTQLKQTRTKCVNRQLFSPLTSISLLRKTGLLGV